MKKLKILNLGGGVGSAPLVGLMIQGEVDWDYAVFADTGAEPAWVYRQIDWLDEQLQRNGFDPIVRVDNGSLANDLIRGENSTGQRFASIPAFTANGSMIRRQCTAEYKIQPVTRWIRRKLLQLAPRQRIPKNAMITQLFGFSTDEAHRAGRMRKQETQNWRFGFPLLDPDILMTKNDCRNFMANWAPFDWHWSSCTFCPFHSNLQWRELKHLDPDGWQQAVETDRQLRRPGAIINRQMDQQMYLHRSGKPLEDIDLDESQGTLFDLICEGGCQT